MSCSLLWCEGEKEKRKDGMLRQDSSPKEVNKRTLEVIKIQYDNFMCTKANSVELGDS